MDDTVTCIDPGTDVLRSEITALRAEVARLRRIEAVAAEFCARCERGEIRSTSTYLRFMKALHPSESPMQETQCRWSAEVVKAKRKNVSADSASEFSEQDTSE
jgi:hypothetical protein